MPDALRWDDGYSTSRSVEVTLQLPRRGPDHASECLKVSVDCRHRAVLDCITVDRVEHNIVEAAHPTERLEKVVDPVPVAIRYSASVGLQPVGPMCSSIPTEDRDSRVEVGKQRLVARVEVIGRHEAHHL